MLSIYYYIYIYVINIFELLKLLNIVIFLIGLNLKINKIQLHIHY